MKGEGLETQWKDCGWVRPICFVMHHVRRTLFFAIFNSAQ